MVDLLPCPFCGGSADRIDIEDGDNAGGSCVICTQCNASGNVEFGFKENFISNWNRRAESPKWQPIETAPHDEVVLLYWEDWSGAKYMEAAQASHGQTFPNGYSNVSRHGSATHWMPLPAAPN